MAKVKAEPLRHTAPFRKVVLPRDGEHGHASVACLLPRYLMHATLDVHAIKNRAGILMDMEPKTAHWHLDKS
jgi:hypothetical protein